MPNVMVALPNIGGALCSTPQSLADAHYYRCRTVSFFLQTIWGALQQLVYRRLRIRDFEHLKEVLQTCWEQIGQDFIDRAIGQLRKRLSLVFATV